jgi:hypothetical protein
VSRQCNKRCSYCDLDFFDSWLDSDKVAKITSFLNKNAEKVDYFHINFFWWEPLLRFEMISEFVSKINISNIRYSIWTNGFFLTSEMLKFFKENNFDIYLSIDTFWWIQSIKSKDFRGYEEMIYVNFIVDPNKVLDWISILEDIYDLWLKKLNFMPVYSTKNRDKDSLKNLLKLKKIAEKIFWNIETFCYYNGLSKEKQFIIDHDLSVNYDLDSLLWLQKQYKILPDNLKEKVERESYIWNLEKLTFNDVIFWYNEDNLKSIVLEIPQKIWKNKENIILSKLLKNGTKKG